MRRLSLSDPPPVNGKAGLVPSLRHRRDRVRHRFQPLRELIPPRSGDHQSFLRPGHADIEEFHVLGGLVFRGFDLAEADEDHGAEFEVLTEWGHCS